MKKNFFCSAHMGNLREFNPVHLFFPARANFQFKRTRLKTYKTKSTPCPKSKYNPTLSLTLKPTPLLTLTLPLTLKHYPRKNTLKQKTRIEIPNVTPICSIHFFSLAMFAKSVYLQTTIEYLSTDCESGRVMN